MTSFLTKRVSTACKTNLNCRECLSTADQQCGWVTSGNAPICIVANNFWGPVESIVTQKNGCPVDTNPFSPPTPNPIIQIPLGLVTPQTRPMPLPRPQGVLDQVTQNIQISQFRTCQECVAAGRSWQVAQCNPTSACLVADTGMYTLKLHKKKIMLTEFYCFVLLLLQLTTTQPYVSQS